MQPNFTKFSCVLPVALSQSCSDGVAICYVLSVLWMTSCFHTMGLIGGRTGTALCTSSSVAAGGRRPMWVGWPVRSQAVLLPRRPRTRDVALATALQSTQGRSQCLRKQSAVMTIEAATTLWPCGGLCSEEVRHIDVKIV